ncbi:hypothetical protein ANN_19455 [Periplaneta americana]|uniref:DUF659 domain-containing protein n=1 Tax=Periplaneta americana TaxID=6978 RepID=A0ABQ8SAH5_PERAM|nr:hypothetical protein ANN_19455 [Periplaneta americana]
MRLFVNAEYLKKERKGERTQQQHSQFNAIMPKNISAKSTLIRQWLTEYSEFTYDGKIIFCKICKQISQEKKCHLKQHVQGAAHKAKGQQKNQLQQTLLTQPTSSNLSSNFYADLTRAFVAANIPWNAIENPVLRQFLQKYCKRNIPSESTLRKNYLDRIYNETLASIREDIGDSYIWVSVDETSDPMDRYIANMVVGKLSPDGPSIPHLVCVKELSKVNSQAIAYFVNKGLQSLYSDTFHIRRSCQPRARKGVVGNNDDDRRPSQILAPQRRPTTAAYYGAPTRIINYINSKQVDGGIRHTSFRNFSCAAQQLNASQSTHRFSFVNHTIKTVNMPKVRHSVNLKSKLTSYISEFKEDGLSTDNKILFCNLCQCAVSSTQKFLVQQHITTSKHQANKQLNSKQRQLFLTQPTTSNVISEFNIDLCRSLISADIPLYKLKNKVFREFLEKYTQHTIPDESTLRKTYAPSIYDETIQKIRDEIKDSSIWVSIDETPDKEGRLVGNVVIGLLSEQYSERILLHCDVLEKCNNKTIVKLFNEAMDAVSIDTAKTVTCDISVKNDLAHIQHTFSCIIKTLKSLQNRHLSLSESFEIINSTVEQLNRGRGKVADAVRAKVDTVLSKNPGYEELQKVVAVMSGESTVKINLDLSPADIVKLNYVPVTSCDVERSFSQYKSILRDNRRRFTFQHLKEMFVTYCYGNRQ